MAVLLLIQAIDESGRYFGRNITNSMMGHAAIATSSKYALEMPGKKISTHTSKATFFRRNSGGQKNVVVYRIKFHTAYANKAATYAYNYKYRKTNPSYMINLYHKSPSYCSKYVYLAYWWGATKSALTNYRGIPHIVTPHGLIENFVGSFVPKYICKVTRY
ncbi:hypothetical protein [Lactobacillus xylocopicola]|uniref:Uncharacterized protein n=1 Tax=Lactobacillus xylocopicola TaxID=2976676 RepID=A0ABM8BIH9_9LACO|nr:hypothetical protein [Lactobacillus xylocopicola]BDR60919.1 hypothetical protein KIM322_11800 [Lactobacillus xylocopicola]